MSSSSPRNTVKTHDFFDEDPIYDSDLYKEVVSFRKHRKKLLFVSLGLIFLNAILGISLISVTGNKTSNENDQDLPESNQTSNPTNSPTTTRLLPINVLDLSTVPDDTFLLSTLFCGQLDSQTEVNDNDDIYVSCFQDQPLFCSAGNSITLNGCDDGTSCSCTPGLPLNVSNNPSPPDLCFPNGSVENGRTDCPQPPLKTLTFNFFGFTENLTEAELERFNGATNFAQLINICTESTQDFAVCQETDRRSTFLCRDNIVTNNNCLDPFLCNCVPGQLNTIESVCNANSDEFQCGAIQ